LTVLKFAQNIANLGANFFLKKSPSTFKSRPIGENTPNLVTLEKKKTRVAAFLRNKMVKMAIGYVFT
jgi:hypothetical protein